MPLPPIREDVDSFRLGFMDVTEVPGVIENVVVERNWETLLLGVVSVSVAFESALIVPKDIWFGDGGGRSSTGRASSGLAYGWLYSYWGPELVEERPSNELSSRYTSA